MKAGFKKQFLNQFLNLFWTILFFLPVVFYWYSAGSSLWFYLFLIAGYLMGFMTTPVFNLLQLHRFTELFGLKGIKVIRKFVQDGDMINRSIRKDSPTHKVISDKTVIRKYLNTIRMYERFHFVCFVFFLLMSGHAFIFRSFGYFAMISAGNFLYNVCPILLQQYNRARILKLINRVSYAA